MAPWALGLVAQDLRVRARKVLVLRAQVDLNSLGSMGNPSESLLFIANFESVESLGHWQGCGLVPFYYCCGVQRCQPLRNGRIFLRSHKI